MTTTILSYDELEAMILAKLRASEAGRNINKVTITPELDAKGQESFGIWVHQVPFCPTRNAWQCRSRAIAPVVASSLGAIQSDAAMLSNRGRLGIWRRRN